MKTLSKRVLLGVTYITCGLVMLALWYLYRSWTMQSAELFGLKTLGTQYVSLLEVSVDGGLHFHLRFAEPKRKAVGRACIHPWRNVGYLGLDKWSCVYVLDRDEWRREVRW